MMTVVTVLTLVVIVFIAIIAEVKLRRQDRDGPAPGNPADVTDNEY